MKAALFVLFLCMAGYIYQDYDKTLAAQQDAAAARKELKEAREQLAVFQQKAQAADQARVQLAAYQQQLGETQRQLAVARQPVAAAAQGTVNGQGAAVQQRPAGLAGFGTTALDQGAQPTTSRMNSPVGRRH